VTEDQNLQRERSQRKLLNKQVNRQVQALKSSKKRVESLQAALDRVKNDKALLNIEVSTLKKQIQLERDLMYDEKRVEQAKRGSRSLVFPLVQQRVVLYRGGLTVSGQLLMATLTHTCEHTAKRIGRSHVAEGEEGGACLQCMWCRGKMCVSENQQLTIIAVKLGGFGVIEDDESEGGEHNGDVADTHGDESRQLQELECAVDSVTEQAALLEAVLAGPAAIGAELGQRLALLNGRVVCSF
jgi:hypothetical protein